MQEGLLTPSGLLVFLPRTDQEVKPQSHQGCWVREDSSQRCLQAEGLLGAGVGVGRPGMAWPLSAQGQDDSEYTATGVRGRGRRVELFCTILSSTVSVLSAGHCARRWSYGSELGVVLSSHSGGDW